MTTAARRADVKLRNIVMPSNSHHRIFVMFAIAPDARTGTYWPFEMLQLTASKERVIGGLSGRIEIVPATRDRRSPLRDERRGGQRPTRRWPGRRF